MIERYFTKQGFNVYDLFKWKKVDVEIKDYQTGEIIFEGHDLEFPEHYSQQACDIIASKYFFRNIDGNGTPETSLRQVVHRMVRFWVEALIDEGIIDGSWVIGSDYRFDSFIDVECSNYFIGEAEILYDELVYTLLNQMWAPNSPQWFNTGIGYYGVKGESDDLYYCDEEGIHKSPDRYTRSQTSACFIIPVTDHLIGKNSITDHYVTETKLFKGGSGVGTNFSPLRAEGERLSSGGKSSGVMSFLLGLDRNAGAIKSGGTTRRAAKMVILDVDHPDIEDFIDWKVHEEKKAQDLISLGYDGGMNGEAYTTVSGQNSNNSVRVSDEFMEKVLWNDPDSSWELKGRVDSEKDKIVDAHELWDKICTAAWECADPGIQFDDRYNEWHTAPNSGRINATNPCSEYAFLDNSACNLASINVMEFSNYDDFTALVHLCQLVLEASIHWGQFPTEEVAENSYKFRATGLGLANLGALFLKMGIPYDSEESRKLAGEIAAHMTAQSYLTSAEIAEEIGCCEGYDENAEDLIRIVTKHLEYAEQKCSMNACRIFEEALNKINNYGVRNMQVTVMAPTGTISLAMDCLTTGIEPFFSHKVFKKCSDGSMLEMVNPLAEEFADSTTPFDEVKSLINEHFDDHGTYQGCEELTEEDQKVLQTANEISPEAHVEMMAAIQPYISGSISKTVNLPHSATVEDVKNIYELAYKKGLKSISIYRDGSKGTQPLTTKIDTEEVTKIQELPYIESIPKEEFLPKKISLSVQDNQNILVRSSQEQIDIESNKPLLVLDEESNYKYDSQSNNFVPLTEEENNELYKKISRDEPVTEEYPYHTVSESKDIHLRAYESQVIRLTSQDDLTIVESTSPVLFIQPEEIPQKFERRKPESVRRSRTHAAKIGQVELYITVSYYESGDLCEIFVSSDKEGTEIKGLLSSLSKAISHMLQYGIEPLKIAEMLKNQRYEPQGSVERHAYIKMATSISDLIARVIEFECGDYTRCHIKPEENIKTTHTYPVKLAEEIVDHLAEESQELFNKNPFKDYKVLEHTAIPVEYSSEPCPICGSYRMKPNGTCLICEVCGETSGCS